MGTASSALWSKAFLWCSLISFEHWKTVKSVSIGLLCRCTAYKSEGWSWGVSWGGLCCVALYSAEAYMYHRSRSQDSADMQDGPSSTSRKLRSSFFIALTHVAAGLAAPNTQTMHRAADRRVYLTARRRRKEETGSVGSCMECFLSLCAVYYWLHAPSTLRKSVERVLKHIQL